MWDNSKPHQGWPSAEHEQLACIVEHAPLDAGMTLSGSLDQRVCERGWAWVRPRDGAYLPTFAGRKEYERVLELEAKEEADA